MGRAHWNDRLCRSGRVDGRFIADHHAWSILLYTRRFSGDWLGTARQERRQLFAQRERGVIFGLWSTNYAVGGLVASAFAGWCGDQFGWHRAFYIPGTRALGDRGTLLVLPAKPTRGCRTEAN